MYKALTATLPSFCTLKKVARGYQGPLEKIGFESLVKRGPVKK